MNTIPYDEAARVIGHGDLLLKRGTWWHPVDAAIMTAGRSRYVHAAMAACERIGSSGFVVGFRCVEITQFHGGRMRPLRAVVAQEPGRWDVFTTNPERRRSEFDPAEAVKTMKRFAGTPYGWRNLVGTGLMHLPVVRWLVRADLDDEAQPRHPPYCSQAVAIACRAGGVDPVPNLADRMTEPGDLARSPFFRYRFTLV